MASACVTKDEPDDPKFPSWLANHLTIDWNADDIDALLTSIDASQSPQPPSLPHLPAEILILILEYIPIAYTLDWRLVCRGFRDAIDGPVLYHHLQRSRLSGYLGPKASPLMRSLNDHDYDRMRLVPTEFQSMGNGPSLPDLQQRLKPLWANKHAVFEIRISWFAMYNSIKERWNLSPVSDMLSQIALIRTDQGYGTLTWALELDTAVLDLDFPLEPNRSTFDVSVDTNSLKVYVEWKPMLFQFLKTERALRLLVKKTQGSSFSFNHAEDCLRAIRRQRLHAALDPGSKIDRHIKWSLRLLRPLWGVRAHRDPSTLDAAENDAVEILLFLRRKAALSKPQITRLYELNREYRTMIRTMDNFSRSVMEMKQKLILPGHETIIGIEVPQDDRIPVNPIAWSDELRVSIENRVQKWKAQRDLVEKMQALMVVSQEAFAVPEDAFDVMDSDF